MLSPCPAAPRRNDFDTEFGPTNVETHAVSTAVEWEDAGLTPEVAQQIDA
jgi:hypothetical protein